MGFLLPGTLSAQEQDIEGSQDHPLISRYKGSYIDGYDVRGFDAFRLALGKRTTDAEGNLVPERKKDLKGKVTRILYRPPVERSPLEIFRNYEMELKRVGFEILFKCAQQAQCGYQYQAVVYPSERRFKRRKARSSGFDLPQDIHYLAAKMPSASGNIY